MTPATIATAPSITAHASECLDGHHATRPQRGQATDAGRARAELGWKPSHSGLVDEFRNGSHRKVSAAT